MFDSTLSLNRPMQVLRVAIEVEFVQAFIIISKFSGRKTLSWLELTGIESLDFHVELGQFRRFIHGIERKKRDETFYYQSKISDSLRELEIVLRCIACGQ